MKRIVCAAIAAFFVCAIIAPSGLVRASTVVVQSDGDGSGCGKERAHIKQIDDADASNIRTTAVDTTVDALRALPVPSGFTTRNDTSRYPAELQIYRVRALWIGWKVETDHDYHLVIAQPDSPAHTMIAESVDPTCPLAAASSFAPAFKSVRSAFTQCALVPKAAYHKFAHPAIVEIEGPAFFDIPHGQTGHAPNAIEIHAITAIRSLECPT